MLAPIILCVVLGPVLPAVLLAAFSRRVSRLTIFLSATLLLPCSSFVLGSVSLAYALASPGFGESGGDGVAFFAMVFTALILPGLLLIPGAVSGTFALLLSELLFTRR